MKMNILIIEPSGRLATFQYAHNLANALSERGHRVILATGLDFETKHYPRKYKAFEVFNRFLPRPKALWRFLHYVRWFKPHILHIQGHSHPTSYIAIQFLIKAMSPVLFVYTAQDIVPKIKKKHHNRSLKHLYHLAAHIFVNANQNKLNLLDKFPLVSPDKVTVIPLADLTGFVKEGAGQPCPYIPKNKKVILFFGNIEPRKGILYLIRAFVIVREKVPNAFLLILGKPFEDISHYLKAIHNFGLQDHVVFSGKYLPLNQIESLFRSTALVVLPYEKGWNSGVIATAYGHETPVVASDVGGFQEVIQDGRTGLLVPPKDEKSLAAGIISILNNPELHKKMIEAVKTEAVLNSWPEIARVTEKVYTAVLENASARGT